MKAVPKLCPPKTIDAIKKPNSIYDICDIFEIYIFTCNNTESFAKRFALPEIQHALLYLAKPIF